MVLSLNRDSCTLNIQPSTVYVGDSCKPADFHHLWTAGGLPADGTAENGGQSMKMSTEDLTVTACYPVSNSYNIISTNHVVSL